MDNQSLDMKKVFQEMRKDLKNQIKFIRYNDWKKMVMNLMT